MKFSKTRLADAVLIDLDRVADDRGFFARVFCADEFAAQGLVTDYPQANHSHNARRHPARHALPARRRTARSSWCAA